MPTNVVTNKSAELSIREELAMGPINKKKKNLLKPCPNITVCVRKKILTKNDIKANNFDVIDKVSKTTLILNELRKEISGNDKITQHSFSFDRYYDENTPNAQIYKSCIKQLVESIFTKGLRCSCFAFGQTGSGKTFTMIGPSKSHSYHGQSQHIGIWILAGIDCLNYLKRPEYSQFELVITFFEIHCNKAYDLLNNRNKVRPLEHSDKTVVIKGLVEVVIDSEEKLIATIEQGSQQRSTGINSKNNESSRSHGILQMIIRNKITTYENISTGSMKRMSYIAAGTSVTKVSQNKSVFTQQYHGKLAFIDLAGSERGSDSFHFGKAAQSDGAGINKSLLALKECIRAMDLGKEHIPFRDSELTKILREYFTNNQSLCVMIATLSASSACCEQTLNTLRYAQRFIAVRYNSEPCIASDNEDNNNDMEIEHINLNTMQVSTDDNSKTSLIKDELAIDELNINSMDENKSTFYTDSMCSQAKNYLPTKNNTTIIDSNLNETMTEEIKTNAVTEISPIVQLSVSEPIDTTNELTSSNTHRLRAIDAIRKIRPNEPNDIDLPKIQTFNKESKIASSIAEKIKRYSLNQSNVLPQSETVNEQNTDIESTNSILIENIVLPQSYLEKLTTEISISKLKQLLEDKSDNENLNSITLDENLIVEDLASISRSELNDLSHVLSSNLLQAYEELIQSQALSLRDVVAMSTVHIRLCRFMENSINFTTTRTAQRASFCAKAANIDGNSTKLCQELLSKEISKLQKVSDLFQKFAKVYEYWSKVQEEEKLRTQNDFLLFNEA